MTPFRARRAVGLLLAGSVGAQTGQNAPCFDSTTGATCIECYSLWDARCEMGTPVENCVGADFIWCGYNPCNSCSGCYRDGTCDTTVNDQNNCFYWNGIWCGAEDPMCTGCNSCHLTAATG